MWRVDRWVKREGKPGRWALVGTMTEAEALARLNAMRGQEIMQAVCMGPEPGAWVRMWTLGDGSLARLRYP